MSVDRNDAHHYESEDGAITIDVDFADPMEREVIIFYSDVSDEDKESILNTHEEWVRDVLSLYDVDLEDGTVDGTEVDEDGVTDILIFSPSDDDVYSDGDDDDEEN